MYIIPTDLNYLDKFLKDGYIKFKFVKIYEQGFLIDLFHDEKAYVYLMVNSNFVKTCKFELSNECELKNTILSIRDIDRICFLTKEVYQQYKNKINVLHISSGFLSHKNFIEFLIHQTSANNLLQILNSDNLLTVGQVKNKSNITKVYNEGTLSRTHIKYNANKKYDDNIALSHEIDAVYFRVKFQNIPYERDEETDNPVFLYLKPSILKNYKWYLNYVDNFGFPDRRTIFKQNEDFIIDHPDFIANMFELVVFGPIKNLHSYISYICIPKHLKNQYVDLTKSLNIKWY